MLLDVNFLQNVPLKMFFTDPPEDLKLFQDFSHILILFICDSVIAISIFIYIHNYINLNLFTVIKYSTFEIIVSI